MNTYNNTYKYIRMMYYERILIQKGKCNSLRTAPVENILNRDCTDKKIEPSILAQMPTLYIRSVCLSADFGRGA